MSELRTIQKFEQIILEQRAEIEQLKEALAMMPLPMAAARIEQGQCWRKKTGEFVYLAISESAKNFYGLDADKLYGVCFNGNMAAVSLATEVVRMPVAAMFANQDQQNANEPATIKLDALHTVHDDGTITTEHGVTVRADMPGLVRLTDGDEDLRPKSAGSWGPGGLFDPNAEEGDDS